MKRSPKPSRPQPLKSSNWGIEQLPGLSPQDQAKLVESGITTTHHLLQTANNSTQKQALATHLQIHIQHVNKWVALADLARIPAVGCQYAGLLLHSGVCSVAQLAQIAPQTLHKQILRFYVANLQRQDLCPAEGQIVQWIQQAQLLKR